MKPPTDKLKAAIKQLQSEREQIIEAAIESGTAIRVTVGVTSHGGSLENEKERKLTELKAAGEKRQIYFDEMVIETGVPRSREFYERSGVTADDAPKERGRPGEAIRAAEGLRAEYRPAQASGPPTEPRSIRATIQLPNTGAPQGEIAEGFYQVIGNDMVLVRDAKGNPLGRVTLKPGEDPEAAARQLLKSKTTGSSNFYGPLRYGPSSIH